MWKVIWKNIPKSRMGDSATLIRASKTQAFRGNFAANESFSKEAWSATHSRFATWNIGGVRRHPAGLARLFFGATRKNLWSNSPNFRLVLLSVSGLAAQFLLSSHNPPLRVIFFYFILPFFSSLVLQTRNCLKEQVLTVARFIDSDRIPTTLEHHLL